MELSVNCFYVFKEIIEIGNEVLQLMMHAV